jgi:hypothetical protein
VAMANEKHNEKDDDRDLDFYGIRSLWDSFQKSKDPAFVQWVLGRRAPTIIEWGYPPGCLHLVRRMHEAGITAWWLTGDHEIARVEHERLGKPVSGFDWQTANITKAWPKMQAFYDDRIIQRRGADGPGASNEEVFKKLFPTTAKRTP